MSRRVALLAALELLCLSIGVLVSLRIAAAQSDKFSAIDQTTQPSNTAVLRPPKWEYRILQDRDTARLEREANRLGEQGFEIFAFQVVQPYAAETRSGDAYFVMVLKRPKS